MNFFFEILAIYEIMWKNYLEPARPQMTIWRMRIPCSIPKATNIQSYHVILIAFPLQQWLHDRASVLRYTYTALLVYDESRLTCSSPKPTSIKISISIPTFILVLSLIPSLGL